MSVKKYFYYHVSVVAIFFITVPLTSFAQIATQMPAMSQPATDTTPPTITHVVTTSAGITDATIVWNTNVPATSKFEYGKTKNYGTSAVMDTAQLTTHAINLMNLSSGTTYFYCIHATDMAGNETASCEHSFVTAPPVVTTSTPFLDTTDEMIVAEDEVAAEPKDNLESPAELINLTTAHTIEDKTDLDTNISVQTWARFSDAVGNPKNLFAPQKENVYIRIFNPAVNSHDDERDRVVVTLTTVGNVRDVERITLVETTDNSGLFVGAIGFHLAAVATHGNKSIEFNGQGKMRFSYFGLPHVAAISGPSLHRSRPTIPSDRFLQIDGGATTTTSRVVTLNMKAANAVWMAISNNKNFLGSIWQKMQPSIRWKLSEKFGEKTVYIKFESSSGGQSKPISQMIAFVKQETAIDQSLSKQTTPPVELLPIRDVGKLVRSLAQPDVYFVQNGVRHSFLTRGVFRSWFGETPTVEIISNAELAAFPLGASLGVRPGTRLVKFNTHGTVYAVEPGAVLREIPSAKIGAAIYGASWEKRILLLPDTSMAYYTKGTPIRNEIDIPMGTLISYGSEKRIGLVIASQTVAPLSISGFAKNRFQEQYVIPVGELSSLQFVKSIDELVE